MKKVQTGPVKPCLALPFDRPEMHSELRALRDGCSPTVAQPWRLVTCNCALQVIKGTLGPMPQVGGVSPPRVVRLTRALLRLGSIDRRSAGVLSSLARVCS
jgi:hypothetical protein